MIQLIRIINQIKNKWFNEIICSNENNTQTNNNYTIII